MDTRNLSTGFISGMGRTNFRTSRRTMPHVKEVLSSIATFERVAASCSASIEQHSIGTEESRQILCRHSLLKLLPIYGSPLVELINDVNAYDSTSSIHMIVRAPATDERVIQDGLAASEIKDLF
eukprot:IDg15431t1